MKNFNSCLHVVMWLKSLLPHIGDEFGRIPPIKKLAELKGCSIATMHKAIKELENQGLCVSKQGHGTYVRNNQNVPIDNSSKNALIFNIQDQLEKSKNPHYILLVPIVANTYVHSKEVSNYLIYFYAGAMKESERVEINLEIQFIEPSSKLWRKQLKELILYMKNMHTKAIITTSIVSAHTFQSLYSTKIPFLVVDHWVTGLNLSTINPNYFSATEELILVLNNMKHSRIGLFDRKDDMLNPELFNGYQAGIDKAGLEFDPSIVFNISEKEISKQSIMKKIEQLFQSNHRPTAFITYSSNMAINLIKLLEQINLKVPRDISVVTFCSKKVYINGIAISGIIFDWESIGVMAIQKMTEIVDDQYHLGADHYHDFIFLPGNTISFNSLL